MSVLPSDFRISDHLFTDSLNLAQNLCKSEHGVFDVRVFKPGLNLRFNIYLFSRFSSIQRILLGTNLQNTPQEMQQTNFLSFKLI